MHGLLSFAVVTFYWCEDNVRILCSHINHVVSQDHWPPFCCFFAGVVSNYLVHCINSSLGFVVIKNNFGLLEKFKVYIRQNPIVKHKGVNFDLVWVN